MKSIYQKVENWKYGFALSIKKNVQEKMGVCTEFSYITLLFTVSILD